jgi:hypothetical protein
MFGHDSLPSQVIKYGAKPPTLNAHLVFDELYQMHKYRNKLVELELDRRKKSDAIVAELRPQLAAAEAAAANADQRLTEALSAASKKNAEARSKIVTEAEKSAIAEIRKERKAAFDQRKLIRAEAFASRDVRVKLDEIEVAHRAAEKVAYAECGLYWGNKLIVAQSCSTLRKGAPPRFQRFDPNGRIAVQVQGGLPTRDAMDGAGTLVQIDPPSCRKDIEWGRRAGCRSVVRFRIGSEADRRPIWAEFPVTLHRPLPDNADIKWAYMVRRRIATHDYWSLQLVVSRAGGFAKPECSKAGEVGIDVGWRLTDAGLRVAYWVGSDGEEGELVLPTSDLSRWTKPEEIQSVRDTHFNGAIETLACCRDGEKIPDYPAEHARWVAKHRGKNAVEQRNLLTEKLAWDAVRLILPLSNPPEWFSERVKEIRKWKAHAKLAALVLFWRDNRFPGDAVMFDALEQWRKRDRHLYEWQENQRRKTLAWRKETYRCFAAMLRRKYKVAVIEDCNWAQLQKNAEVDENQKPGGAKANMRVASVGSLLEIVRQAMETVSVDAKNTSRIHAQCGQPSGEPNPALLFHTCQNCDVMYDQDRNAAANLLARASGKVVSI